MVATKPAAGELDDPALEAIWQVVGSIPRGRVSTYGTVARVVEFLEGMKKEPNRTSASRRKK
jgi:alkylated DNA nucleotide flippase Atl1